MTVAIVVVTGLSPEVKKLYEDFPWIRGGCYVCPINFNLSERLVVSRAWLHPSVLDEDFSGHVGLAPYHLDFDRNNAEISFRLN